MKSARTGLPFVAGLTLGAAVGVIATWKSGRKNRAVELDAPPAQGPLTLLPRLFLLQAFSEQIGTIAADIVASKGKWDSAREAIETRLAKIQGKVEKVQSNPSCAGELCDAIEELVQLLRDRNLEVWVQGNLPRAGESWELFGRNQMLLPAQAAPIDVTSQDSGEIRKLNTVGSDEQREAERAILEGFRIVLSDLSGQLAALSKAITSPALRQTASVIAPTKLPGYSVVKVFYATDRHVTVEGDYVGRYGSRKGLHYGHIDVGIPGNHQPGMTETPPNKIDADPFSHIVILSMDTTYRGDQRAFIHGLNDRFPAAEGKGDELLLFIHGYNCTLKGAALRAAQLKVDLGFEGQVMAYSWSSEGTLHGYLHDEVAVKKTEGHLAELLNALMKECSAKRIHVIAHSMGNRALIGALQRVRDDKRLLPKLSNVILAAADESRKKMEDILPGLFVDKPGEVSEQERAMLSVYCALNDLALSVSKVWHRETRLGETASILKSTQSTLVEDVLDASLLKKSWGDLHHSYYGDVEAVIQDIATLLLGKKRARERVSEKLVEQTYQGTKKFYEFKP